MLASIHRNVHCALQDAKLASHGSVTSMKAKAASAAAALDARKKGVDIVFLVDITGSMVQLKRYNWKASCQWTLPLQSRILDWTVSSMDATHS